MPSALSDDELFVRAGVMQALVKYNRTVLNQYKDSILAKINTINESQKEIDAKKTAIRELI